MKHVSILIPKGHTSLVNIEGTRPCFGGAELGLGTSKRSQLLHVELLV